MDGARRRFGVGAAILALVVFFGVQVGAGLVLGIAKAAVFRRMSMAVVIAVATALSFFVVLLVLPLFVQAWIRRPWRSRVALKILGLTPASRTQLAYGGIAGLALAVLLAGLMAVWPVPADFDPGPLAKMIAESRTAHYIFAVAAILLAPVVEEMTFRGALFAGLRKRMTPAGAAVLISVFFTVIHFGEIWGYWPAILAIGTLAAGTMAFRMGTGSARPAIMMHFTYNLVVTLLPL